MHESDYSDRSIHRAREHSRRLMPSDEGSPGITREMLERALHVSYMRGVYAALNETPDQEVLRIMTKPNANAQTAELTPDQIATVLTDAIEPGPRRRFFRCDDNGEHYDFVATDFAHAKKILADSGMQTIADADKEFGTEPVEWTELTSSAAALIVCDVTEGPPPTKANGRKSMPLAECDLGNWFSSVW